MRRNKDKKKKSSQYKAERNLMRRKSGPVKVLFKQSNDPFLASYEWRKLRMQALVKYGAICMCCGAKPPDAVINVDHIKPRAVYPQLALSLDNLQVLCHDCNHGKGNWDETDWRPR